jgi:glycosyltransferase involved in cell wall biosynthesis
MPCSVSIIVPVYKVEDYIDKCITSILSQTFVDIEIILVDDGSPDNCGQIADLYAEKDSRIKVIHKENGGLSSARNAGIKIATGEYIGFVDSDDWVEPNMVEVMYKAGKQADADIVISNYRRIYSDKIEDNYLKLKSETIDLKDMGLKEYIFKYFFPYIHGHEAWNKLFKRKIIEKNQLKFEKNADIFSEDMLFNLYVLCHINNICSVDVTLYNYLQRENSIMNSPRPNLINQYCTLFERFKIHANVAEKLELLKPILPLFYYDLLLTAINVTVKSGVSLEVLYKALIQLSDFESFNYNMLYLVRKNDIRKYLKQINPGIKKEISCRLFSLLCFCKFYYVVAVWKYKSINRSMT